MSSSKKAKTDVDRESFDRLRTYLQGCAVVPASSPAMLGALKGLEEAEKRFNRDRKLQQKFAKSAISASTASPASPNNSGAAGETLINEHSDDVVHVPRIHQINMSLKGGGSNDDELHEWQDVQTSSPRQQEEASILGRRLAAASIARMSQAGTRVSNPLAALALALHSALVSDVLNFACTGIPDDGSTSKGGFAPPVRELPKAVFVPNKWDTSNDIVRLRYRKTGLGAAVLSCQGTGTTVQVQLNPTSTLEPSPSTLRFSLDDHINIESFSAALAKDRNVLPALHYKSLAMLLSRFSSSFDLGGVIEEEGASDRLPYVDATTVVPPGTAALASAPVSLPDSKRSQLRLGPDARQPRYPPVFNDQDSPTIAVFQQRRPRGDFAGDLDFAPGLPGGLHPGGGNLMGPGHPTFGHVGGVPPAGGMRPRFDPYGPPPLHPRFDEAGNTGQGRGIKRPGGEPNPDHLKPPSDLSNNMFM